VWCGGVQSDSEYLRWIKHDLRARGLDERVRFIGVMEEMGPLYRAAQVFVLPSREDPFPLVALEAVHAGLPVLAFIGGGGAPELLEVSMSCGYPTAIFPGWHGGSVHSCGMPTSGAI